MKTKSEILHLLSIYKPTAESKYGLTRIGIFGSVARGELRYQERIYNSRWRIQCQKRCDLLGDDGIIQLLRNAGYKVELIKLK